MRLNGNSGLSMSDRQKMLRQVADIVLELAVVHVVRVGIDGVDGAGKTVFGNELARFLKTSGRPIIRASLDSFAPAPPRRQ